MPLNSVGGFDVVQNAVEAPRPPAAGHVVEMAADIVDGDGEPIPINRLMLHHIVFLNTGRPDQSCMQDIKVFDGMTAVPPFERFFAAGEERAKMKLPAGYGYDLSDQTPDNGFNDRWIVLYMVMNHQKTTETDAFIEYTMKIDDSPAIESVIPWWLDVANCSADPIYNVKGDGEADEQSVRSADFQLDQSRLGASGGRIVAAGGHVHGGAYQLDLTRPNCEQEPFFSSMPKWGGANHPFYTVRPILHEPGPVNMSAFTSSEGYPIRAGEPLRFDSIYDDSQPHTRVMGISVAYVAPDSSVQSCGPDPTDVDYFGPDPPQAPPGQDPYRDDPIPFEIPLVSEDTTDPIGYEEINKPPGELKEYRDGTKIKVTNANELPKPNIKIHKGDTLKWKFRNSTSNLHNITLANGPEAIGSPNLSLDQAGDPRVFEKKFKTPGQYKLFCALHPTLMHERVVVKK